MLIPLAGPRYDWDLERDLEEYNRAMGLMAPSNGKSKHGKQGIKVNTAPAVAEFNFEAEFDDIIDVNAHSQDI